MSLSPPVGAIWLAQELSNAPMTTQNISCFSTAAKIADNDGYCYKRDESTEVLLPNPFNRNQ